MLIVGGFGYVGGRFAQYCAATSNDEIQLGTRQLVSSPSWLPNAKVSRIDWSSKRALEDACARVDVVVHMAGMNLPDSAADPVAALEVNAVHTSRLVQAAIQQRVTKFLYVSTAHVYGTLAGTIDEKTCAASIHPYAASHRAGEDAVRAAGASGAIEGVVVRLSNAYGPPVDPGTNCWMLLINDLCRQAVTSRAIALRSSGLQRRNFIPMSDACAAIDHLRRLPASHLRGAIANVGSEWSPTIWEVACLVRQRCAEVLGFEPDVTRVTPAAGESHLNLDYRSDLLRETGFQAASDRVAEIDRLLQFCSASFS